MSSSAAPRAADIHVDILTDSEAEEHMIILRSKRRMVLADDTAKVDTKSVKKEDKQRKHKLNDHDIPTTTNAETGAEGGPEREAENPYDDESDTEMNLICGECFAGSMNLTSALCEAGLPTAAFDIRIGGETHDFSKRKNVEKMKEELYGLEYVHMAPPCNTYSTARWPKLRRSPRPTSPAHMQILRITVCVPCVRTRVFRKNAHTPEENN